MNIKLPFRQYIRLIFVAGLFVASTSNISAVSVAEQTQTWSDPLTVWEALQELGNNLSGTASSFTFRVSTSRTNLNQFDFTTRNTRIYDKDNNNSYIIGCPGTNHNDPLDGLTFTTTGVPIGYEDVTIDFSCRNYNFIPGHRYLIFITNANNGNAGSGKILFTSAAYGPGGHGGSDLFSGGGLRYAFDNGFCNASQYIWNSQTSNSGCNVFSSTKDDLYFILSNTSPPPPPPRLPVIFIPGIGGSEIKASQDIIWSAQDGHGGTYSHAYSSNEKIWVNQDKAAELGDDDYFDILRLKTDGQTPEAALSLTGDLTSFGYSDIDSFFTGMGYEKGKNFFTFPYDWRKDVRNTKDSLDNLIETAKIASGQSQVNLVVHSMGGLVARYYISDSVKAAKVNKLIELGVPHLGAVDSLKTLRYGSWLGYDFRLFKLGIPPSETKDTSQNLPSIFELLPSSKYFDFYTNTDNTISYPYKDDRDIDNNNEIGALNFNQTKTLLSNLGHNMTAFNIGEEFHTLQDSLFNQTNDVKVYEIVGSSQSTLGQIHETWWVTWPINLIPKRDEVFVNGDGTVPLYSASLKNDSIDISGATKIYYVEQEHGDLVSSNGTAMQTVKAILNDDNSLPVEVKDEKIVLEGEQISLDDGELDLYDDQNRHCGLNDKGEIEENIPDVSCTTSGNTKHAFVKKKAAKVKVKTTRKNPSNNSKTTSLKKRTYKQDKISKTTIYKDIAIPQVGKVEFTLDPALDTSPSLNFYPDSSSEINIPINPTSETTGSAALDQTPPVTNIQISGTKDSSGVYTGPVTITLTGSDTESGILRIEYSLDNGQTVQTYTGPFTISNPGTTTIQIKSIDNLGNEEIPQSITIEIAVSPSPTLIPTPTQTPTSIISSGTSSNSTSNTVSTSEVDSDSSEVNSKRETTNQSSNSILSTPDVLGITFQNPNHISDQINVSKVLEEQKNLISNKNDEKPAEEFLGGLLIVSGGIITLASFGLLATFLKQSPK
ncbi:MAG: hypothetical protein PHE48_01520 [Candidatus Daviesbacteria bacterium]|nr:hypothetical protein [Candidatus Daviesbacteria bacterium]